MDDGTVWTLVNSCRPGPTGSDATAADTGAWVTATTYNENDRCTHAKSGYGQCVYRSKITHTSSATTEPEVGATWATYWELWCGGGANGAGSGDVTGPASSTTNNILTFYDTGGKRAKDSGIPISRVAFHTLTAFTGAVDPENDCVCMLDYSGSTYYKCLTKKIHRATDTISLMSQGLWKRSAYLPSSAPKDHDLPTTRFDLKAIEFGHSAISYANCSFVMPESWNGGALQAIFIGTTPTATAGTVRMAISARMAADGESCDVAGSALAGVTMTTHEAAYKMIYSNAVSFTPAAYVDASRSGGNKILLQICRYVTYEDTLAEDFWLTDVVIRYGVGDD